MRLSRVFFAAGGAVFALGAVAMLNYIYSPNVSSTYNSLQEVRSQVLAEKARAQSAGRLAELTPALRQNEAASAAQGVKGPLGLFAMVAGFSMVLVGFMVHDKEAYRRGKEQRQASPTF